MCFMCPPPERGPPNLFNITGIPLKVPTRTTPPLPPPAAASFANVDSPVQRQTTSASSARYSAFKALKAQRKADAVSEPEPEPQVHGELVTEAEALQMANAAAQNSTKGRSAGRRVGCCIIDSVDGAGKVVVVSSNSWDLPLAPNTGICAERRALAALMLHGKLDELAQWAMVVSHSPCAHCAATILLFPEISRVVFGKGAPHRDLGVELLQRNGRVVEKLANDLESLAPADSVAEQHQLPTKRPRPLPEPTALRSCELRNRGGSLLYRAETAQLSNGSRSIVSAQETLIAAARHAAAHASFVEQPGLMEGCTLQVDQPLNFLEKLFCATCGVQVEVLPVDVVRVGTAGAEATQAREGRSHRLSAKQISNR